MIVYMDGYKRADGHRYIHKCAIVANALSSPLGGNNVYRQRARRYGRQSPSDAMYETDNNEQQDGCCPKIAEEYKYIARKSNQQYLLAGIQVYDKSRKRTNKHQRNGIRCQYNTRLRLGNAHLFGNI